MTKLYKLKSKVLAILKAFYCLFFVNALHAEPIETLDVFGRENTKNESLVSVDKDAYTAVFYTIDRSQFEDRFTPVVELLSDIPSVQIKSSAGLGSYSSASIRGSSGKQVNVFLDGLLLNSAFSGNASINNIPSSVLQSIDVYPSFTPIELSSANLAGAISLNSRSLQDSEKGLQASLAYGSFDTKSADLSSWAEINEWELLAALSYVDSANDYPVDDDAFCLSR